MGDINEVVCELSDTTCHDVIYTYHVNEFAHLMLAINSSTNFIFYMIHIPLYREQMLKVQYDICVYVCVCIQY